MNKLLVLTIVFALCGCGLETAGTAATSAGLKQQELKAAQQTMQQVEDRVGQMNQQTADRMRELDD
jgi:NifU-like protein involved in Fe-S cluster formation